MITFDAALSTSKLEAVEYDLGPTCCAIETSACAQTRTNIPLGVCWRCPRAITNELIIAPSQHARTFTRADKHVEWLPRLPRRSSGQLVTLVAVINHPLQMTWRAAPHHSEGSLSAARSGRSSFLDGMDCPHVKVARLELWAVTYFTTTYLLTFLCFCLFCPLLPKFGPPMT